MLQVLTYPFYFMQEYANIRHYTKKIFYEIFILYNKNMEV